MQKAVVFDEALIQRYDVQGPRYTSYPAAPQFREGFQAESFREALRRSRDAKRSLSLYFHIPFCSKLCFYCACNKVVTKNHALAEPYVQRLGREVAEYARFLSAEQPVVQMHWGGGTPTFLSLPQMTILMDVIHRNFSVLGHDRAEISIEVDPRTADASLIEGLRHLGFNRLSLGVQDLDPRVQHAVNRVQPFALTRDVMMAAKRAGYLSVGMDLIYGLPYQTASTFQETLEKVIELAPDRLSVFNYAHLPERFTPQRRISQETLPSAREKLDIFRQATERLVDAGYVYIGMDHFAKPNDDLAIAQRNGTLQRNFQGYSTAGHCDLIGFGVSAISKVGGVFAQNARELEQYNKALDAGDWPTWRGYTMQHDDELRAAIISRLICDFQLDIQLFERRFGVKFAHYFADVIPALEKFQADGLIRFDTDSIDVLPRGRLLIRAICMAFDAYAQQANTLTRYSKVI